MYSGTPYEPEHAAIRRHRSPKRIPPAEKWFPYRPKKQTRPRKERNTA